MQPQPVTRASKPRVRKNKEISDIYDKPFCESPEIPLAMLLRNVPEPSHKHRQYPPKGP